MNSQKKSAETILRLLRFDQQNLEAHAHEPPDLPYELNGINNYYGNGENIRRYASLPKGEPLPFVVEHFVPLDYETPHDYDLLSDLPAFLAVHEKRAEAYTALGIQGIAVGSGIHYAKQLLDREEPWKKPLEREGTVAFPHKSTRESDRSFDYDAFADWLVSLPEEYQPVIVCISWRDFLRNKHLAYLKRNIPVVGCGNILDPKFLFRFIDLCSHFQYSCGNAIGSCYPFSVLCGCHYIYQDFGGVFEKRKDTIRHLSAPGAMSELGAKLKELAPYPPDPAMLDEQRDLVDYVTGKKHLLSPEKIRGLFARSRQQLLDRQPSTFACMEPAKLADLNTWLPKYIYPDGWTGSLSRVILRASNQAKAFTAYMEFPLWFFDDTRTFRVHIGRSKMTEFECPPAYYKLTLPIAPVDETPVRFEMSEEKPLSTDDPRKASFRFLGWELENKEISEATCSPIAGDELPDFIRSPDRQD